MADGFFFSPEGDILLDASGDALITTNEKCPECGCGQVSGPCCASGQDCTILDDGHGNWAPVSTSSLVLHIDAASGPWSQNVPGVSPAVTMDVSIAATMAVKRFGLAWCNGADNHVYSIERGFNYTNITDVGSIVTSSSSSASSPFYNYQAQGPVDGLTPLTAGMGATISVLAGSPISSFGVVIYGTPQNSGRRIVALVTGGAAGYEKYDGNRNYRQNYGSFGLVIEVYADGSAAIWDYYGSTGISNSFTVTPIAVGACVRGATIGFTVARKASSSGAPVTTYSGTFAMEWTAGIGKCKEAPTPAATPESCAMMTTDGKAAPYPPAAMPAAMAQAIVDRMLDF